MNQLTSSLSHLQVAVGSHNPTKVGAVADLFGQRWPQSAIIPVTVDSAVSAMPMTSAECIVGARHRAMVARTAIEADFGVGLEGGVNPEPWGLMLLGWVVIVDKFGREGVGCTAQLPLPAVLAQAILDGQELGPLLDKILQTEKINQKGGASGALSDGLITRRLCFGQAVAYALSPFVAPHFYR